MAFLSQDLFEVFDEKTEPVSLSGKKRKRPNPQEGKAPKEEQKRFRGEGQEGTSSSAAAVEEGAESVIDLTGIDEADRKEDIAVPM